MAWVVRFPRLIGKLGCDCPSFAVSRANDGPETLPTGGGVPNATLDLAPGAYVVHAKFMAGNRSDTTEHMVKGTLRRSAWLAWPWWDYSAVRLGVRWKAGEFQVLSLFTPLSIWM